MVAGDRGYKVINKIKRILDKYFQYNLSELDYEASNKGTHGFIFI